MMECHDRVQWIKLTSIGATFILSLFLGSCSEDPIIQDDDRPSIIITATAVIPFYKVFREDTTH